MTIGATSLLSISSSDTRIKHFDSKSKTSTRMVGVFDLVLLQQGRDIAFTRELPYIWEHKSKAMKATSVRKRRGRHLDIEDGVGTRRSQQIR